ncbi:AraC family transcriptional regulator [Parashewanella spongiae]|uniref:AraC family transcriptional regulator n=2 Tax=Parashewanella spongiae TaxID=342950 RepID=A0A3A6TW20_9GAMM|nr:AraC family transcriptional regulator [Parashewanella spongiae]
MDILDDVFNTLNLQGALYFRTDFSSPWGVTVPQYSNAARFHLVLQGHCYVKISEEKVIHLTVGDLILIPRGVSHIISDVPNGKAPPLERLLTDVGYTGDGVLTVGSGDINASTQLVCGHFSFREQADHPILRALPDYLVSSATFRAKHPLMDEILRMISRRVFDDHLGSAASVTRLSEIVFIELIRSGIQQNSALSSILEACRDPKISQSLKLIHSQHSQPWTVESLASKVAMSRSRFSDRFSKLIGTGPMAYLSDWRLQKALALLDSSRMSVQQIADQTGYQSPSAFTRAFSGKFGASPSDYRRNML